MERLEGENLTPGRQLVMMCLISRQSSLLSSLFSPPRGLHRVDRFRYLSPSRGTILNAAAAVYPTRGHPSRPCIDRPLSPYRSLTGYSGVDAQGLHGHTVVVVVGCVLHVVPARRSRESRKPCSSGEHLAAHLVPGLRWTE